MDFLDDRLSRQYEERIRDSGLEKNTYDDRMIKPCGLMYYDCIHTVVNGCAPSQWRRGAAPAALSWSWGC